MHMLQTHAPAILPVIVFILMLFPPSTNTICMRFRFDPLSRAFSNRCVFNENAQRISVDGRPNLIEMYGFSSVDQTRQSSLYSCGRIAGFHCIHK